MSNNGYPPYSYAHYNTVTSLVSPSTVHVSNSPLSLFFQRYLFQRILSVFKWRLPKTWAENYFLTVLYMWGYIAVFNTNKYGPIPQGAGLRGYNIFYQPSHAIITNPLLTGIKDLQIGKMCEIIKLAPDYQGVYDIISYYGDQLALISQALGVNLINSKLAYVFISNNKNAAESLKKMYDKIANGEPAVFIDKKLKQNEDTEAWEFIQQNVSQNHIAGDLLNEMRTILDMFDTEIGIPNANTQKRERLVTAEVESNKIETLSKASLWMDTMRIGIDKVNKMFNLDIAVNWRFRPEGALTGGDNNQSLDISSRDL